MNRTDKTNPQPKKEWAIPELKKIDIEQITAAGGKKTGPGSDAYQGAS